MISQPMKILIVCSGNAPDVEFNKNQAFIYDQIEAIKRVDPEIHFETFFIQGRGVIGYLKSRKRLISKIRRSHFHCLHAHFSFSALLANLQTRLPVVATFHGSDINFFKNRIISFIVELLSRRTIYVSTKLLNRAICVFPKKSTVISCGVDFDLFKPAHKLNARVKLRLSSDKTYILFSSGFHIKVKNYSLAKKALEKLSRFNVELLELQGYSRKDVALLFSAVDVALMTSFSEGSPQFIKEAMACNCPVVATDVGDVREIFGNTEGCYLTSFDPQDVADKIEKALAYGKRTNGRKNIQHLDNAVIAEKVIQVYKKAVKSDNICGDSNDNLSNS